MSAISERFFRLFAFLATFFPEPEELLIETVDGSQIEKRAKKRSEKGKRFAEQFLSMKIQSVFDVREELHFEFMRVPAGSENASDASEDNSEWSG